MRSMTGRTHAIVLGLGVAAVAVVAVETFTRMPPLRSATAAPLSITVPAPVLGPPRFAETLDVGTFQRGNIHTHSKWSDGDRPPKDVYAWYRTHGYQFLALTDHDNRVSPETFKLLEKKGFVIIAGEEVTMNVGDKPVHVNGLCTQKTIGGGRFPTKRAALVHAVESIHAQGGSALVNHPNFGWALGIDDVREARGAELLEIWSGHPLREHRRRPRKAEPRGHLGHARRRGTNHRGRRGRRLASPRHDEEARSGGAPRQGLGPGLRRAHEPRRDLRGAPERSALLVVGRHALARPRRDGQTLRVGRRKRARPSSSSATAARSSRRRNARGGRRGHVRALGRGERYVRARVTLPNGKKAWTQPYRVTR